MLLAESDMVEEILKHISDHPWDYPWSQIEILGMKVTLMSSAIVEMVLAAVVLAAVIIPVARRHRYGPKGSANVLEVLVVFVRDMIARPALHEKAYEYLPFLLTLFVYILGMNLLGILPLEAVSHLANLPLMGQTATSLPSVCAALGSLALLKIVYTGLCVQARKAHRERGWAMWKCALGSPVLWIGSLGPQIPGLVGKLLLVPLALLELIGAVAKCFALMIRLFANMLSGHTLVAVLMVFIFRAIGAFLETRATHLFYVGPAAIMGSVVVNLLELLVAGLQAYIFTFLTAMFLGLYAEPSRETA